MYHKNFRKSKYRHLFLKVIHFFAFCTFVSTLLHFFRVDVIPKAIVYIQAVFPHRRDRQGQIHKAVERETLISTFHALYATAKLSFEQIRNYGIISFSKVVEPNLRLDINGFLVAIDCFVFWLFANTIQLIMHTIKKES